MKMEPAKSFVAAVDLSKPSLQGLSHALRRVSFNFTWNYNFRERCAIRVAEEMWGVSIYPLAATLGITQEVADSIFCLLHRKLRISRARVTPEMVADEIDDVLARMAKVVR